jgi:alpha-beta hydrolase superfamily lysophospholipase
MGFPEHRGHGVLAHGLAHRFAQLVRAVMEPVDTASRQDQCSVYSRNPIMCVAWDVYFPG